MIRQWRYPCPRLLVLLAASSFGLAACDQPMVSAPAEQRAATPASTTQVGDTSAKLLLYQKISAGSATLPEVKRALALGDPSWQVNVLHGLYAMRGQPAVRELLHDLWRDQRERHADLPWNNLQLTPQRVALASTMNRISAGTIPEFMDYIRAQANNEQIIVRSQVAFTLGVNGDNNDLPMLITLAQDESVPVSQSAITGLGFMYSSEARQALIKLREKYADSPRGDFITSMLREAYNWPPMQPLNSKQAVQSTPQGNEEPPVTSGQK